MHVSIFLICVSHKEPCLKLWIIHELLTISWRLQHRSRRISTRSRSQSRARIRGGLMLQQRRWALGSRAKAAAACIFNSQSCLSFLLLKGQKSASCRKASAIITPNSSWCTKETKVNPVNNIQRPLGRVFTSKCHQLFHTEPDFPAG